jgi:hypothetical protein
VTTPKFDSEDRKKIKMVVTLFGRKKIIFSNMEKFQRWTTDRDLEWARHVNISNLLNVYLSLIWPLVKELMNFVVLAK